MIEWRRSHGGAATPIHEWTRVESETYHDFHQGWTIELPNGLLPVAPDLVIEVKSPSDRWMDLFVKVGEYLKAGVRVIVLIDSETATVSVYRPDHLQETLTADKSLTLPEVLPGFSVPVVKLLG